MELALIYVNRVGVTWDGVFIYEFLFGDSEILGDVDGEDWDVYPSSGLPHPPVDFAEKVKFLYTEIDLSLIQNSDTFSVWEAVDGIMALAWEEIKDYDQYPDYRIYFRFGESLEDVERKLFQKELEWSDKIRVKEKKK